MNSAPRTTRRHKVLLSALLSCGFLAILHQFTTLIVINTAFLSLYASTLITPQPALNFLAIKEGRTGSPSNPLTIVIELNGQMANQLCKIAYGYALAWMLEEDYGISAKPILRHQALKKWLRSRQQVVACFPKFRDADFSAGNTDEFKIREEQQQNWLGEDVHGKLKSAVCKNESCVRESLQTVVKVLREDMATRPALDGPNNITLPFLRADTPADFGYTIDRYYERFRELFEYDHENPICCQKTARPDETVVHIRAFFGELPDKALARDGFEELSPNKTARELLGNHDPGDKVVVLSRSPSHIGPYLDAMRATGLDVRYVDHDSGHQTFCMLMSAKLEMIGVSKSTFAVWAAYLGNATKARLYSVKSPRQIKLYPSNGWVGYNYTHPKLKDRILMELYSSEEQDRIERKGNRL
jgi:hypothetical protein